MRTFFLVFAAASALSCAGRLPIADTAAYPPMPDPEAEPAGPKLRSPYRPPADAAWDLVDDAGLEGRQVWLHRASGAVINISIRDYADCDVDSTLEKKLAELREASIVTNDLKFFSHGTIIGYAWPDADKAGRIAARGFPDPNGPHLLVFDGTWTSEHDAAMAEEFDRFVKETH